MIVSVATPSEAPALSTTTLSVDNIFTNPIYDEDKPRVMVWAQDKKTYFTIDGSNSKDSKNKGVIQVDIKSGEKTVIFSAKELTPAGQDEALPIDDIELSQDESLLLIYTNSQRVWRRKTRGDYWIISRSDKKLKKLGGDAPASTMQFAKISPTGTHVAYVQANNIYAQNINDLGIQQITTDGSKTIINGTADWVNEEELSIRDGFRWSPDGQSIAFWQFNTEGVPVFRLINNIDGLYPTITEFAYPKVGQTNSITRIGVAALQGEPVKWLDIPGDPRQHYIPVIGWSLDSKHVMLHQLNRLQNTNTVMLADAKTGTAKTVLVEKDDAWVENENTVEWLNKGQQFLWMSDRDGWRHIYIADTQTGECTLITPGKFDVIEIEAVDEAHGWVYYSAAPNEPTQRFLFRVNVNSKETERLTPAALSGWNTYQFSPDAQWAIHTHSNFKTPPTVNLISSNTHKVQRTLIDNAELKKKAASLNDVQADFFRVDIGDGSDENLKFDGWIIKPKNIDSNKKYPLFFYVYGEPAGQTVRDSWGGRSALWHWMLAQQGYVVISIDTRGTKVSRGRAWRKSIYEKIGIMAPVDFAAATKKVLERWSFIDPQRIGVWGWSGGGSNTLHAIFRYPELYKTAIAVAPNPSQLLYDSIYQERYMGLPEKNAEAFRIGSPITYAENLQGNLLLIHGTGDDNGHYQGSETLINKLIKHNKMFDFMSYPTRSHSLSEGDGTVTHLYTRMTTYLHKHLPLNK